MCEVTPDDRSEMLKAFALLRELAWIPVGNGAWHCPLCRECDEVHNERHDPTCRLAALLYREEK